MAEFNLYQKRQLFEQGWVVIPQVNPAEMVRAARYAINSTIENYLDSIQVCAHELKTDERLTNMLMKTDAFPLIESARQGQSRAFNYQLAHTAATNLRQATRDAVYIRMHHADRPKDSLDVLTDIWKYWYGMSEVASKD